MKRDKFYQTMAGILLLIVLVGFTRTFYLRALFDVPDVPDSQVYLHGAVMTAWYLLFFVQTSLVMAGRTPVHRRLGVFGGFLGAAVFVTSAVVNWESAAWDVERGFALAGSSEIVWSNLGAMIAFGTLFSAAIYYRKRVEIHKRLMLLASISMIGPALARIAFWPTIGVEE